MSRPQWLADLYRQKRRAARLQQDQQDDISDGELAEQDEARMLAESYEYAP